jgi:DNA-binding response OmpR family regulator
VSSLAASQKDGKESDVTMIFVVDDECAITDLVSDVLSEEGYQVRVCHDGASALLGIQTDAPDLVLLDIGLPVMTGDVVLRELRATGFDWLPIIITTAGTNPERYLADGATAILKKPFTLDRLIELVSCHAPG